MDLSEDVLENHKHLLLLFYEALFQLIVFLAKLLDPREYDLLYLLCARFPVQQALLHRVQTLFVDALDARRITNCGLLVLVGL